MEDESVPKDRQVQILDCASGPGITVSNVFIYTNQRTSSESPFFKVYNVREEFVGPHTENLVVMKHIDKDGITIIRKNKDHSSDSVFIPMSTITRIESEGKPQ